MMNFALVQNANVKLDVINSDAGSMPVITVNDTYQHAFPSKSRVTQGLNFFSPEQLQDRLDGGHYFFIDNKLVDYRDSEYNGFVHSDNSINKLMDIIGYRPCTNKKFNRKENLVSRDVTLSNVWSKASIDVPAYKNGGQFDSELDFIWNPFMRDIRSTFRIVRQICTNGMVGMSDFINTRIPVINRWEEHLDIASVQIQHKIEAKVSNRLDSMGTTHSSVGQCLLINDHINDRLENAIDTYGAHPMVERLKNLNLVTNPKLHTSDVYRSSVFENRQIAAQHPAHLSEFDLYNIVTEVNTHTDPSSGSSRAALDKMANALVFDENNKVLANVVRPAVRTSSFFSPEQAFFGLND